MTKPTSWSDVVRPIVERYRLGASFGLEVAQNPDGCAALASLLSNMAAALDRAVAMALAEPPDVLDHFRDDQESPRKY